LDELKSLSKSIFTLSEIFKRSVIGKWGKWAGYKKKSFLIAAFIISDFYWDFKLSF